MRAVATTLLFAAVAGFSCNSVPLHEPGGPFYFRSWSGYQIPFRPQAPVSRDNAMKLDTYYEAFFNSGGRITSITKYYAGKLEWRDQYEYRGKNLIRRTMTKASGEATTTTFE